METKKKPDVDVRKYRSVFFNIGLALSLGLVLAAFEWKTYGEANLIAKRPIIDIVEIQLPITTIDPPPPPKPIKLVEIPKEDESTIEEELPNISSEMTEQTKIPDYTIEDPDPEPVDESPFVPIEQMPSYKNGLADFYKYISKKIRYPSTARKLGIEGKVFVVFDIDKNGEVTNVKLLKGIGGGCDEEAMRVIKQSPKWNPGKQRGKPVKVTMTLPITFKLN